MNDDRAQPTSQSKSEPQPSLNMSYSISRPTRPGSAIPFSEPNVHKYRMQGTPPCMILFAMFMAIFIIAGGGGLIYWSSNHPHGQNGQSQDPSQVSLTANASASLTATANANTTATAIANMNPYISSASTLVMDDPLNNNNQSSRMAGKYSGDLSLH